MPAGTAFFIARLIRSGLFYTHTSMKAQDIPLTLDQVLFSVRPGLQKKVLYSLDLIRKAEKMALRLNPGNGFYNTFSGGKDSQWI